MSGTEKTKSESQLSLINQNVFFKEFTFSNNDFKSNDNFEQELADNVVWLDEYCFIFQIKEMNQTSSNYENWFKNKVINKAVKQIKNTLHYFDVHDSIIIENERGHKMNVKAANEVKDIKKIIIYSANVDFPETLRYQKFYESSDAGNIHLFHIEDYFYICKYLITPTEISEYLNFREDFLEFHKLAIHRVPEQYLLGHFFETLNVDHFNAKYIDNVQKYKKEEDFDISGLIENFKQAVISSTSSVDTHYYRIIKAIAKLHRFELIEFKKRISVAMEKCEKFEFITPYKMYSERTDCAFVFIPIHSINFQHAITALKNYTYAIKQDCRSQKALGVVIYRNPDNLEKIDTGWYFLDETWTFDPVMDKKLKENYPFRESINKKTKNPYK